MGNYALFMHIIPLRQSSASPARSPRSYLSATHLVRAARASDAADIHQLVTEQAESGVLLPRTGEEIGDAIDNFVVVADQHGRVMGCAALHEYSPALGEVGSVVVAPEAQGRGLGSIAVRGVEGIARRRGIEELFAVTLADHFFSSLGFERCAIGRYPEKLARYDALMQRGVHIVPKSCYRKMIG